MPSAICSVNSTSTSSGTIDVTASSTVTVALVDGTGANTWTLQAVYPDDTVSLSTINSSISINQTTKVATFTAPSAGSLILRSVINSGSDINGNIVPAYTSQFKVSVPVASLRTVCSNETTEGHPSFGWVKPVNDLVRAVQTGGGGGSFTAGGDLTGTSTSQTVAKIQGVTISGTPATGKTIVLTSSSAGSWTTPPGGAPSGSASGDLSSTYPNPTVSKVNGASVPAAGSLASGNVLKVSGASSLTYGAVNLAGGSGDVTGVLPAANQANQTLTGDVTGNTGASVVSKVNGVTITGTPVSGYVITATSPTTATWSAGGGGGSFTAGGDLGGSSSSQTVLSLTGVSGVVAFPTSTSAPKIQQADNTTASATAHVLTLQAQNATGTTSTGGNIVISSGSGTTASGSVKLQVGGTDKLTIGPSVVSITPTNITRNGNANCKVWEDYTSIQTTNATATTAYSFNLVSNAATHLDVAITAINSANTAGGSFKRSADFRNNAGTAAQINSTIDSSSNLDAGLTWTATVSRSSTTVNVVVTGASGTTIRWGVYVSVMETTS